MKSYSPAQSKSAPHRSYLYSTLYQPVTDCKNKHYKLHVGSYINCCRWTSWIIFRLTHLHWKSYQGSRLFIATKCSLFIVSSDKSGIILALVIFFARSFNWWFNCCFCSWINTLFHRQQFCLVWGLVDSCSHSSFACFQITDHPLQAAKFSIPSTKVITSDPIHVKSTSHMKGSPLAAPSDPGWGRWRSRRWGRGCPPVGILGNTGPLSLTSFIFHWGIVKRGEKEILRY